MGGFLKKVGSFAMKVVKSPIFKMALNFIPGGSLVSGALKAFSAVSGGGGGIGGMFKSLASSFLKNPSSMMSGGGNNILSSFLSQSNQNGGGSGGISDILSTLRRTFTQQADTQTRESVSRNMSSQAAYYQSQQARTQFV